MGTAARCLGTTLRRVLAAALPLVVVTACATPAFDRGAYLQNAKAALGRALPRVVVVVGVLGICVFAEMSGRVAAVSGRATPARWASSGGCRPTSSRASGCQGGEDRLAGEPVQASPTQVAVCRRLHRNHRYVPIEAVAGIDWHERVVTLTRAARPIHPHER